MFVSCRFFGIKPFRFLEAAYLPEVSLQLFHSFWMILSRFLLVISLIAALPLPALIAAEENFLEVASLVIMTNIPVMIIEGIVTAFCIGFLRKVGPEMLPGGE